MTRVTMEVLSDTGQYATGDAHIIFRRSDTPKDGSVTPVIYAHGAGSSAGETTGAGFGDDFRKVLWRIAAAGLPVMAIDAGGTSTFGNDLSIARMFAAATYFASTWGVSATRLLFAGTSMGGQISLNAARTQQALVKGVVGMFPATDFDDAGLASYASQVDTAYGGHSAWLAAKPTHNPIAYASTLGVPVHILYSNGDPTVRPVTVTAFKAAMAAAPCTTQALSAAGGHVVSQMTDAEIKTATDFLLAHA